MDSHIMELEFRRRKHFYTTKSCSYLYCIRNIQRNINCCLPARLNYNSDYYFKYKREHNRKRKHLLRKQYHSLCYRRRNLFVEYGRNKCFHQCFTFRNYFVHLRCKQRKLCRYNDSKCECESGACTELYCNSCQLQWRWRNCNCECERRKLSLHVSMVAIRWQRLTCIKSFRRKLYSDGDGCRRVFKYTNSFRHKHRNNYCNSKLN